MCARNLWHRCATQGWERLDAAHRAQPVGDGRAMDGDALILLHGLHALLRAEVGLVQGVMPEVRPSPPPSSCRAGAAGRARYPGAPRARRAAPRRPSPPGPGAAPSPPRPPPHRLLNDPRGELGTLGPLLRLLLRARPWHRRDGRRRAHGLSEPGRPDCAKICSRVRRGRGGARRGRFARFFIAGPWRARCARRSARPPPSRDQPRDARSAPWSRAWCGPTGRRASGD